MIRVFRVEGDRLLRRDMGSFGITNAPSDTHIYRQRKERNRYA